MASAAAHSESNDVSATCSSVDETRAQRLQSAASAASMSCSKELKGAHCAVLAARGEECASSCFLFFGGRSEVARGVHKSDSSECDGDAQAFESDLLR